MTGVNWEALVALFPDLNVGQQPGVFKPQDSNVVFKDLGPDIAGVTRWYDPSTAYVNDAITTSPSPRVNKRNLLNTATHELGHTAQNAFKKNASRMEGGIPMLGYSSQDQYPKPREVAATLRDVEAMQKAGHTVWSTDIGRAYLNSFLTANPDMTEAGARRYLELRMFPEHQLMHETDNTPTTPNSWTDQIKRGLGSLTGK